MSVLKQIGSQAQAILAVFILIITTTLSFIHILFIGLFKLFPNRDWQARCTRAVGQISIIWSGFNNFYVDKIQRMKLEISGQENLSCKNWYLVVANHQSWLDIVILHRLFNRKIPVLKFFIKDQLKWVPLLGFSWWAMGCPFMKRYSKEYLAKNPHKKGKDLASTRQAIEIFKRTPASVMNFIEGTRFTPSKKEHQQSPYDNLLKPKAGGIGFVISSMADKITSILDVTIVYAEEKHSLWDFLCGRTHSAKIVIREIPIPAQFLSTQLLEDAAIHNEFKTWLNDQWAEKDRLITSLK